MKKTNKLCLGAYNLVIDIEFKYVNSIKKDKYVSQYK